VSDQPTEADVIAMADHPLVAVWQAGVSAATSPDFRDDDDELDEARYVRYALNVMRRTHAQVEAQVRAKVAAEIRAELGVTSCGGACYATDRCVCLGDRIAHLAARIAEGKGDET
jgi:hypothetical protein